MQADGETDRQLERLRDGQKVWKTERERQTDRWRGRLSDRQTERQIDRH